MTLPRRKGETPGDGYETKRRRRQRLCRDIEAEIAGIAAGVDAAVTGQRPKNVGRHLRKGL